MFGLGSLSFAAPLVLVGLLSLPIIWWILRVTPPMPRRERFPALRLLLGLEKRNETPAQTPLWLLILRLLIAALLILGLAGPLLNAQPLAGGSGRLAIVIDTSWTAAANWDRITAAAAEAIEGAKAAGRPVLLIRTAPASRQSLAPMTAERAKSLLQALEPSPFAADLPALTADLSAALKGEAAPAEILWLSDGIAAPGTDAFAAALKTIAPVRIRRPEARDLPLALLPPQSMEDAFEVTMLRADVSAGPRGTLTAYGKNAQTITRLPYEFPRDQLSTLVRFELPLEVRNEILRIGIDGELSSGAVALIDDIDRRRAVGLVSGSAIENEQPLLSDLYFVERALLPSADIRKAPIAKLIEDRASLIILADVGVIAGEDLARMASWVEGGGVLVRFAGPRLASQSDDLIPVVLRRGGRAIGGALSWEQPQKLGPFEETSPFFGLAIPDDVMISRQILAEPSPELSARTWARLADGTPLVTAERRGDGTVILFHVTANTAWSNLPLSGLFVEMLVQVLRLSRAGGAAADAAGGPESLAPRRLLDGFGRLAPPSGAVLPISVAAFAEIRPSPEHPPGLYGLAGAERALNTLRPEDRLAALEPAAMGLAADLYARSKERAFGPLLLTLAFLLALTDGVIALVMQGKLRLTSPWPRPGREGAVTAIFISLGAFALSSPAADAAEDERFLAATLETRLAYVRTGNPGIDQISAAGLRGLTHRLALKTAFEPAPPVGVDIESDEIVAFPILYWPLHGGAAPLSAAAQSKLDRYLKTGGMVLFDTRDADRAAGGLVVTPEQTALRALLSGLDIPPLAPLQSGHVLTRTFYILPEFPGRYAGGEVWIEATSNPQPPGDEIADEAVTNDGVSSLIIGGNDWAAAWAVSAEGNALAAVVPGGEGQRELAYRFGVNLAMYALTGNYKGDAVHQNALKDRLN